MSVRGRWRGLRTALFAGVALGACGASREKPLHVVLIVIDTLRADHLSTYGYPRPTSPELDKLAAEGAVFERAISQASWTQPSMVSMLTGRYLADELMAIPEDQPTLASVFQKGGYTTAAFINNDVIDVKGGFNAGFDVFDYQDSPYGPIDKLQQWIDANRGKRTFTYIHLNEAHDPYDPPQEFDRFVKEKDSVSAERLAWYREISKQLGLKDFENSVRRIGDEIGGYDDDVRYSDDHVGRILAAIRASGEWDKTAIVVAADHGEGLWTHVAYMTGTRQTALEHGEPPTLVNTLHKTHGNQVYYELVHVPLILVAPGMPKNVRVRPCVENVDISSTLLELCDLPRPHAMQGTSLLPLWSQPDVVAHQKRGAFTHTRYVSSFIDQDGFQLIKPTARGECEFDRKPELYDLNKDPEERVDLCPSEPARKDGLSNEIKVRMQSGLSASSVIVANSQALAQLGYLKDEIVDVIKEKYAKASIEELLAALELKNNINCLARIQAAIALTPRTLDEAQKSKLRQLKEFEPSPAILEIYDEVLAK